MRARLVGAATALLIVVGLAATGCGPRAADDDLGSSPAADATDATDAAESTPTSEPTTVTTPMTVSTAETTLDNGAGTVPTNDTVDTPTGPSISAEEIQDIERTLDEIDQILGDLEADLAQD